jgi:hypothetical protein
MWRHPDDADAVGAIDAMFNGPGSPWASLPRAARYRSWGFVSLTNCPLIGMPVYRTNLIRNLRDVGVIGSVSRGEREGPASVNVTVDHDGDGGDAQVAKDDPLLPNSSAVKVPLRACDWYAWRLSALDGAPPFHPYWPEAKRDQERDRMIAFLQRWGDRFRYSAVQQSIDPFGGMPGEDAARMTFPKRDRPATADDVKAATAIFSLSGGPVRTVPLPAWPAKAKWVTLKDYPVQVQGETDGKTGVTKYYDEFLNEGFVWQAEEVQVGGKWQRFYGFVGPHTVAKVPAEQIEFTKDSW